MKTMQKYIFMAVAGMLALNSCSNDDKDEPNEQKAPRLLSFTASYWDFAETRASVFGKSVCFDAGDSISIFSANNDNVKFTTASGGALTSFTGTAVPDDDGYLAIYPYSDGLSIHHTAPGSIGNPTIKGIVIPDHQSDAATSAHGWDPKAFIAYADTTGSIFRFHNACALLKITNRYEPECHSICIMTTGQPLTGKFEMNLFTKQLIPVDTKQFVYVDCVPIPKGKTIYIAVAPIKNETIALEMRFEIAQWLVIAHKYNVTLEAGKIYDLNYFDWDKD